MLTNHKLEAVNTATIKLPRYVQRVFKRGIPYHYLRHRGFPRVSLAGEPWSAEFMATYEAAMGDKPPVGLGHEIEPGTATAVGLAYLRSRGFLDLAPSTRYLRRLAVERFMAEYGVWPIHAISRSVVVEMLELMADTPGAGRNFLSMVRALMLFAVERGLRRDDATVGIKRPRLRKGSGFYSWTEDDIAAFEARFPLGTMARLALALLLYTGQRRADVVKLGRQHLRGDELHIRQQKTGAVLALPVHAELRQAIDAMPPAEHLTFLTLKGAPFAPDGFTQWFRRLSRSAGLPAGASPHGLRKACCRRLAEAGCPANVIAAISGHRSLREIERYTRAADQARLARMGMAAMSSTFGKSEAETLSVNPATRFSNNGKSS